MLTRNHSRKNRVKIYKIYVHINSSSVDRYIYIDENLQKT